MKHLLLLLLFPFFVYSQYCPALGPNQLLPCGVNSTTLTADLSQCGLGGPNPNQTTNYGVTNIPYVAQTNTGTQLFMSDDSQQGPFVFLVIPTHSFGWVLMGGFLFQADNQLHLHHKQYLLLTF